MIQSPDSIKYPFSGPCCFFNFDFVNKQNSHILDDNIDKLKIDFWKDGDKYISNQKNTLKVSDVFINNKLSFFEKHNCPIVKISDEIVWIPKFYSKNMESKNGPYIILNWNSIL